jgi:hypothetical protein
VGQSSRCAACTEAHPVRAREYRCRKNAGEVVSRFRYAEQQEAPVSAEKGRLPVIAVAHFAVKWVTITPYGAALTSLRRFTGR